MAECIEKSFPTCGDCFHVKACMAMLRSSGYEVVDEWNSDASRCGDFVAAADVSPVVRCKNCKHYGWEQEPCHGRTQRFCKLHKGLVVVDRDTFCSYGERRGGEPPDA